MALPTSARSFLKKKITFAELSAAFGEVARGRFADGSVHKAAKRFLEEAEEGELTSDLILHDGDLVLDQLRTSKKPNIGLLIVRGNLTVKGLFQDSLDPNSIVIVTGDLRAERLISAGFLEVHGSVLVEHEALWIDNDGSAEIFGDLRAGFLFTKYHSVKVHGRVAAPLVLGDDDLFESDSEYTFVEETDDEHKVNLLAALPRRALAIEGRPKGDPDDWTIEYVDDEVLARMVRTGKRVFTGTWPPQATKG